MDNIVQALTVGKDREAEVEGRIRAILERGNTTNGIIKDVIEWAPDDLGDLMAVRSTGSVKYVCPYAAFYTITEVKGQSRDEIWDERSDHGDTNRG